MLTSLSQQPSPPSSSHYGSVDEDEIQDEVDDALTQSASVVSPFLSGRHCPRNTVLGLAKNLIIFNVIQP